MNIFGKKRFSDSRTRSVVDGANKKTFYEDETMKNSDKKRTKRTKRSRSTKNKTYGSRQGRML